MMFENDRWMVDVHKMQRSWLTLQCCCCCCCREAAALLSPLPTCHCVTHV